MGKSFAVIGLGKFGCAVATTLCELGHEVLAIDIDEGLVESIADKVTHAVVADATDERALKRLGISEFDAVIVGATESVRVSTLTVILAKELGARYVIAKASDELHAKLLRKTGADKVVFPEKESGTRLARSIVSSSILDYLELSDIYSVAETEIPGAWVGKSIGPSGLNVRHDHGCSIIAIRRAGEIIINIDPNAPLMEDDVLVMIGANDKLKKIADMPS